MARVDSCVMRKEASMRKQGLGVAVAVLASAARADVLHVDADAPLAGDGQTWNTAYRFLQDALAEAEGNPTVTEIRVAQGTYRPDRDEAGNVTEGDREATFQLAGGVSLRGGYAGLGQPDPDSRDIALYETVLSGDLLGDDGPGFLNNDENSYHVVTGSGTSDTAVLDGFTITAGNADGPADPANVGGGMFNDAGSPTITSCTFRGNIAVTGGGMRNDGAGPTVLECLFLENRGSSTGGAIANVLSSPRVEACVFSDNSAQTGGAIVNGAGSLTVVDCTFSANAADGAGGVMWNVNITVVTVVNCVFLNNTAGAHGGVMRNQDTSVTRVVNCLFGGNAAPSGAVMYGIGGCTVHAANCIFADNEATIEGGALRNDGGSHTIFNGILWGNVPDQIADIAQNTTVKFSDVEGGWPGTGNINDDPLFVDPANDDYRHSAGSPCIDAGNNWGVSPDSADLDGNGDFDELTPLDLDGDPRFADDPATGDTGCGIPVVVDMGAYEYQGVPFGPVKLGDIDADGSVGVLDFLELLAAWGPCPSDCCPADLDLDDAVAVGDFLVLLANWG
jgi:hypothetical protein